MRKMNKLTFSSVAILLILTLGFGCSKKEGEAQTENSGSKVNPMEVKGIGPVSKVEIGALDTGKANKGKTAFEGKCAACHKLEEKVVGPALKGITTRRTPEWIMNMILNPVEMTQKDPIAQELLAEHLTQMTFQNVSQEEARDMLEYFRQVDGQK